MVSEETRLVRDAFPIGEWVPCCGLLEGAAHTVRCGDGELEDRRRAWPENSPSVLILTIRPGAAASTIPGRSASTGIPNRPCLTSARLLLPATPHLPRSSTYACEPWPAGPSPSARRSPWPASRRASSSGGRRPRRSEHRVPGTLSRLGELFTHAQARRWSCCGARSCSSPCWPRHRSGAGRASPEIPGSTGTTENTAAARAPGRRVDRPTRGAAVFQLSAAAADDSRPRGDRAVGDVRVRSPSVRSILRSCAVTGMPFERPCRTHAPGATDFSYPIGSGARPIDVPARRPIRQPACRFRLPSLREAYPSVERRHVR